jgi:hypothetical protein
MHTILLHIAGIAILEICFFFYYVGPMETQMFQKTVRILAEEPVKQLDSLILTGQTTYPDTQMILYKLFTIQSNPDNMATDMTNMNNNGQLKREGRNQLLFTQALTWWSILCIISIAIFMLNYYFTRRTLTGPDINETAGSRFLSIETRHGIDTIERPRKSSYDYADDESLFSPRHPKEVALRDSLWCAPSRRKTCLDVTKYVLFGACVILFQFLFFQNIVLLYDPLSIDEMKYMLYSITTSNLNKYQTPPTTRV